MKKPTYEEKCAAIMERRMTGQDVYFRLACGCSGVWRWGDQPRFTVKARTKWNGQHRVARYCQHHSKLFVPVTEHLGRQFVIKQELFWFLMQDLKKLKRTDFDLPGRTAGYLRGESVDGQKHVASCEMRLPSCRSS